MEETRTTAQKRIFPTQEGTDIFRRTGFDRRSGFDRRTSRRLRYLLGGKKDRRKNVELRRHPERRQGYVRISRWSSICSIFSGKLRY